MLAVQLTEWGMHPEFRTVPDPEPTGDQLVLRVDAAGLCRSDLHVMDSSSSRFAYSLPFTLGHEVAGTVVAAGETADDSWVGQRVLVHGLWGCGTCRQCERGNQNYCHALAPSDDGLLSPIGGGLGRDGGLAEFMIVPSADVLVPIGSLDPVAAAPLADAALTAYHAIRTNADVIDRHSVVVVVGVGGLGHLALQILRSFGAGRVVAIETRLDTHALAVQLGAHDCHVSFSDAHGSIAELGGADLVLDFVGAPDTVDAGAEALAPGGRLAVVGSAGGRLTVGKDLGISAGWHVTAPFWGTRDDLRAVVALAQDGILHAEVTTFPFSAALDGYRELRAGSVTGRAVIDMTASRWREETLP
ncbi:MAG: alcohol dehydrogenase catalytic domain-containing protein [Rhodococcus fascians]|uniref:alcohol dehydrogenase catalytic domain-containing protein n=1 Tax=Nocardiaceae TaxID=85025 RepID=UPI00068DA2ED|nr:MULTISPECIES: alcohol dehydrogenase catalytic domain-containing protein [Rhodococcus]OZD11377.1 dehydrogenase [Rhodococcus sp. 06-156-3C]OZD13613.1 dehydrogenase [Rhodococcus sp. 06-156-4a]OZD22047.1 dehydrogenase [Rhodococcus sp. 06-156-4C]OZD30236.1 dehydrogenase [Rhodococcus sp. 06-156-3]OZD37643.1 dehydrogenase [Rhodococcus sp. 06-156-3b]